MWGLDDEGANRSIVPADLNGDGWLDLVVTGIDRPARVHMARCRTEAWLGVELRAPECMFPCAREVSGPPIATEFCNTSTHNC